MLLAFNQGFIRVNSDNILPIEFLADELPILQGIWGSENIQGVEQVGTREIETEPERARLFMKYPRDRVEAVYQKDGLLLEQVIRSLAIEETKPTARAKAPAAK